MYNVKQNRTYPVEFTVTKSGSDAYAVFHGPDAQAAAVEYATFKNAAEEPVR
jgi:hypothetical protein